MKTGDIVIMTVGHILEPNKKKIKGFVVSPPDGFILGVYKDEQGFNYAMYNWRVEPVNCSIGSIKPRYVTLRIDYGFEMIEDTYTHETICKRPAPDQQTINEKDENENR